MTIVSASRRTDLPAFFSVWFMARVREGYFVRVNPFNTKQQKRVSLAPNDVDAIVFWSKNPRPLMPYLGELDQRGYNYYFQFTLNPYTSFWEPHLPSLSERVASFAKLADCLGSSRVVWRYDPVIVSSVTPAAWHLERFSQLAGELHNKTERVVLSFLDSYGKVNSRLQRLHRDNQITVHDITADDRKDELRDLALGFKEIADRWGLEVLSCAEGDLLDGTGIGRGSCIDGKLIKKLFGIERPLPKDKSQRPECLCAESVDMGMYNTCSFQCAYCYANLSEAKIRANLAKHDPEVASMIAVNEKAADAAADAPVPRHHDQLSLF
ncbi:DUF1848 domain-containing protein [Geomonas sp. RF6]|uniref:DUF1848 domain-containing protein n=1 Tax=Geomonas sp. RF6 TaxID=2897342 RepID=UPI001E3BC641|nr:DUF1848 domain-containing protein [Geomonas sp. RF6]UFS72492.1 DUF1848 domain-containing protein [Geomonas sp. RF6]